MRNTLLVIVLVTLFSSTANAATTPHRYIFRCILDEGVGELYQFTGYRYEKIGAYPIYCGDISGPKRQKNDFRSPWGKYSLRNVISYNGYPACYVNYPNQYDRTKNATGSGIMVHGGKSSVGCISVQSAEFLKTKLAALAANGEIHIFPSRMTAEKIVLWKKLLPGEIELIDQLLALYAVIGDCRNEEKHIFSLKVEMVDDPEVFGFEKKQYEFLAGSADGVIDYLKDFITKDSVLWDHVGDDNRGYTRFSLRQTGCASKWVPFKKIEIFLSGVSFAVFTRTSTGFAMSVNVGTPEGLLLIREVQGMYERRSIFGNPVVVYVGERRYVSPQNELPFNFSAPVKYEKGAVIMGNNSEIRIVSVSGETRLSRAAGENGWYVKN